MSGPRTGALLVAGVEGTRLEPETRRLLERVRPGGVILFAKNVASLAEVAAFVRELRALDPELLVAIDQEGGPVDRLRPYVPGLPSALALGAAGDPALARRSGALAGECLGLLGVDLDFAPTCNLALSGADNSIGIRSFGSDPDEASGMAGAFLAGLEEEGVLGCLKHFPGLGGAPVDSHASLPVIPLARTDLMAGEVGVFASLLGRAGAVMVSHGYYPNLTTNGAFPATLSEEVMTGLLREDLGFGGAVVTDDMTMGALDAEEPGSAAVRSLAAGADVLLVCHGLDRVARVAEAVETAVASGKLDDARLADALGRVQMLRARAARVKMEAALRRREPDAALPPTGGRTGAGVAEARLAACLAAMAELAREVAARSAAVVHKPAARSALAGPVVVLRPRVKWLAEESGRPAGSPFLAALGEAGIEAREVAYESERAGETAAELLASPAAPGGWLLATYDAHRKPAVLPAARALAARAPLDHLALSWPRDLEDAPVRASVATRGCGWEAVAEGVRLLAGTAKPRGRPIA